MSKSMVSVPIRWLDGMVEDGSDAAQVGAMEDVAACKILRRAFVDDTAGIDQVAAISVGQGFFDQLLHQKDGDAGAAKKLGPLRAASS